MAPPTPSSSSSSPALLLLLLLCSLSAFAAAAAADDGALESALSSLMMPSSCRGSVGECAVFEAEAEEVPVPRLGLSLSLSRRRLLGGTGGYISYAALRRDSVPCSQRGASYYNCRPGAQANPYSRGCSAITRCRSSS